MRIKTTASCGEKTFCEFFAGTGLVREGLEPSGWSCVYANDVDPKKRQAYEARYGPSDHFHLGDVGEMGRGGPPRSRPPVPGHGVVPVHRQVL